MLECSSIGGFCDLWRDCEDCEERLRKETVERDCGKRLRKTVETMETLLSESLQVAPEESDSLQWRVFAVSCAALESRWKSLERSTSKQAEGIRTIQHFLKSVSARKRITKSDEDTLSINFWISSWKTEFSSSTARAPTISCHRREALCGEALLDESIVSSPARLLEANQRNLHGSHLAPEIKPLNFWRAKALRRFGCVDFEFY